ncbi:MAG: phage virion morphogenesis protein [Pseudomonadota bacterium]
MVGLEFVTSFESTRAELVLDRLSKADKSELLESLAVLGESQTKRRIADEKTSPDGEAWPDWAESTKANRHNGQSLLFAEGDLHGSIAAGDPSGNEIAWGSNLEYAAVHNFGHTFDDGFGKGIEITIPQRQYLGLSADNEREMEMVALGFFREALQ